MRKTYILLSFLSMIFLAFCFCSPNLGDDDEKIKTILKSVKSTLSFAHFTPQKIDDNFSEEVFNKYIESIDPSKRFLLQSDVDFFSQDKYKLDDYFNNQELSFYHATIDTIYQRINDVKEYSKNILKQPFEFNKDEEFQLSSKKETYAKNKVEAKELWRKYLKYNAMLELIRLQKDSLEMDKPFIELEKKAREKVKDDTEDYFRRLSQRKKSDYLSLYINAFAERYDPHTVYFSPKDKDDFDISISGQLEGIGAKLQDKKGYATIMELVVGGPAWKGGELEVGDQIIQVAQEKEDPVNIVGMLLDESIQMIRGKKGTIVTLTIKKKDGSLKDIKITRDVIEQNEVFARSAVITDKNGDKFGIIYLPEFYVNFNDRNGRDPSDDITKEINQLKKENIKGLVFDLRYNGGGSLEEVKEIAGLFIKKGPIVQVKRTDGLLKTLKDNDPSVLYDGPMVVMVNELSASASEIFAAAMQDYKRAPIIGSPHTFGKGTVQTFIPLDRRNYNSTEYGALKLTIQKFYRINGGSTQLKGVLSDIAMESPLAYADVSEGTNEDALPWDQIEALDYEQWEKPINAYALKTRSEKRTANSEYLSLIKKSAEYYKTLEEQESVSLNLEKYKAERDKREEETKIFDALDEYDNHLKITSPTYELSLIKNDTILKERRENWHKNLAKDFYLEESVNVLRDIK